MLYHGFGYKNKKGQRKTIIAESKEQAKKIRHSLVLDPQAEVTKVTRIIKTTNPHIIINVKKDDD